MSIKPDVDKSKIAEFNKYALPSDQLCGNFANEFYEISRVSHMFAVARNIVVGGERKRVVKIMTFKQSLLN